MLSYLVVQDGKGIVQETAAAAINRGTPLEGGEFFVNADKNYDGINSVIDPKEADCEVVAQGAKYNKIPTFTGERYATTELTIGTLADGDPIVVTNGKFVAAGSGVSYSWKYRGVYSNPYGLTMYIVEKVPTATTD